MLFVTAVLVGLLLLGLLVAARELVGFKPEPEWKNLGKLRDRLNSPIAQAPHHRLAGRSEMVRFCLELHREYRTAWRLCRFLAPIGADPQYIGHLLVSKVRFNAILVLAVASAGVGAGRACGDLTEQLRDLGAAMRASALAILTNAEVEHGFSAA